MPYQPGTIRRSGKPCCGSSGAPFMAHTSSTSSLSATSRFRLRAKACSWPASKPRSAPMKAMSTASSRKPTRSSTCRSGVPVHCAVPTASLDPGHARVARGHGAAAVAGALQRDGKRSRRQGHDLVERYGGRLRHAARHLHLPAVVRHVGHVEMIEQVVQAGRRHVVAQGLEQDAVVAVGEPHFLQPIRPLDAGSSFRVLEGVGVGHGSRFLNAG